MKLPAVWIAAEFAFGIALARVVAGGTAAWIGSRSDPPSSASFLEAANPYRVDSRSARVVRTGRLGFETRTDCNRF